MATKKASATGTQTASAGKRKANRAVGGQAWKADSPRSAAGNPTWEQIAGQAYQRYCERCRTGRSGDALSDWLDAEANLRNGA